MYGLAKIAASFDARRNKQYWQMLKHMHGSAEDAMNYIKRTGDDGIWHGTKPEHISQIESKGLEAGDVDSFEGTTFGHGQHFGPKDVAEFYATRGPAYVRLKKPSELKGTEELYPRTDKVISMDFDSPRVRGQAMQRLLFPPQERYTNTFSKGADEEIQSLKESAPDNKISILSKMLQDIKSVVPKKREGSLHEYLWNKSTPIGYPEKLRDLENIDLSSLTDQEITYLTHTLRQGKYLFGPKRSSHEAMGKSEHGWLMSDLGGPAQFHFKDVDNIPPSLLKNESGEEEFTPITDKVNKFSTPDKQEQTKKNLFPLYAGAGAAGVAGAGGLAYMAHKKRQERDSA